MISENAADGSSSRRVALESSLREVLFQIIGFVNEKKDHIPPVQNSELISFPYEISTPRCFSNLHKDLTRPFTISENYLVFVVQLL